MNDLGALSFDVIVADGMERLAGIDLSARAAALRVDWVQNALMIPFFGSLFRVSTDGVTDTCGIPATPAVASLLLGYLLRDSTSFSSVDGWITFREFTDAGPLMSYFTGNTNKLIQSHFAGDIETLKAACSGLNGSLVGALPGIDLCMELIILPRLPMRMNFNSLIRPSSWFTR